MKKTTIFLVCVFLLGLQSQMALARGDYELVIDHSANTLVIKKQDIALKTFYVALGSGGRDGKQKVGDHKTPIGQYRIIKVRNSDRFHLFMQLDYPNVSDAQRALRQGLINEMQYQAILDAHNYDRLPPQNTHLGGAIGIHGIGYETKDKLDIHEVADWTQGCIALRNYEVEQLLQYVDVGTTVKIIE